MIFDKRAQLGAVALLTLPVTLACFGGGGRFSDEREVCDAYFDCLEDLFPDQVGTARAAYGDDSACWDGRDAAEACADGCRLAMEALGECAIPNGGGGGDCMATSAGSEFPDIFPTDGPPSSVGDSVYAQCEPYTGPVYIAYVPPASCSGGNWGFTIEHYGTSGIAYVYMSDRSWGERHPVVQGTSGPNGWYERYELSLSSVPPESVDPGRTTGFGCDPGDDRVVVGVVVQTDSNQILDCVILQRNASSVQVSGFLSAFPEFNDCEVVDGWITGP